MYIFFTRHGQTNWNLESRIQGQKDIELNDAGRKQAESVRDIVKGEKYDLIICSTLKRARETAEIINQALNIPIVEDARLKERSFGKSEGHTKAEIHEIEKEHPEITDIWNYKRNVGYNGIEPFKDFAKRVYDFLDEITKKYHDKRILIVSHGGVFVPIYFYANKIPLEAVTSLEGTPKLKNGDVYKFEI